MCFQIVISKLFASLKCTNVYIRLYAHNKYAVDTTILAVNQAKEMP